MLRFFRHDDGNFALFNGMGPTAPDLIATILAYDDVRGEPISNASHSGYQRLKQNNLLVLMDTGTAPPMGVSQEAHAGCLAFEFCAGGHRIVVNCGVPRDQQGKLAASRTRDAGAFHRHLQQRLVLRLPRGGRVPRTDRRCRSSTVRRGSGWRATSTAIRWCCAPPMTAMDGSASSISAR